MKTLGQQLMDEARGADVNLTKHYWGSHLSYKGPGHYEVLHFRQCFGGMDVYKRERVAVKALRSCKTTLELHTLLKPENDCAPGDPMNYNPRDVQSVKLTWTPKEHVAA